MLSLFSDPYLLSAYLTDNDVTRMGWLTREKQFLFQSDTINLFNVFLRLNRIKEEVIDLTKSQVLHSVGYHGMVIRSITKRCGITDKIVDVPQYNWIYKNSIIMSMGCNASSNDRTGEIQIVQEWFELAKALTRVNFVPDPNFNTIVDESKFTILQSKNGSIISTKIFDKYPTKAEVLHSLDRDCNWPDSMMQELIDTTVDKGRFEHQQSTISITPLSLYKHTIEEVANFNFVMNKWRTQ